MVKLKIPLKALGIVLAGFLIALLIVFWPQITKKWDFKVFSPKEAKLSPKEVKLSPKEVEERILKYLNTYTPKGVGEITIIETKEESGLYKFKLQARGEEFDAYATKDGKLLFLAFVDLTEVFPIK